MLKFLVDAGVGRSVEKVLGSRFDVTSVLDLDPSFPDIEILRIAHEQQRIIVTMDKDFGELIHHNKLSYYGVLLLRLEEAAASEKASVVEQIIDQFSDQLPNSFSVYQHGKLRIRKAVKK